MEVLQFFEPQTKASNRTPNAMFGSIARLYHMTDQEQKVCDGCHARPAVRHTYFGHTGEARSLCLECFEQLASPEELASWKHAEQVIRDGKCQYCGAPALGGSITGSISGISGFMERETHLRCEPCLLDLVEFSNRTENAIPDFPFDDEIAQERVPQQLAERERRLEEFMRRRVRERTSQ